jgi:lipopolysaccharide/colanic/teichoic acid biosynthesis glycosyltransferase
VKQSGLPLALKRAIDVALAGAGLVAAAPVLGAAALAVRVTMGAPVLFRQRRPGKGGVPFEIYKLRTMLDALDERGHPRPDAERLTRLGRFLRATSIDELPELFNVLEGTMSLVGPRPLLMQYLERYSAEQARRHEVLPGITGWAQVNGRNALTHERRFELDVWYVDHWSPRLDLEILVRTLFTVFAREGIAHEGHATMFEFQGTPPNQVEA